MKLQSLFNEYESYNDLGREFDKRVHAALQPIVDDAVARGIKLRDLCYVMESEASAAVATAIVRRNAEAYRRRQEDRDRG